MFKRVWMVAVGVLVVGSMTALAVGSAQAAPRPTLPDLPISLPVDGEAVPLRVSDPSGPTPVTGTITGFTTRRGQLVALADLQTARGSVNRVAVPIVDIVDGTGAVEGEIGTQQVACEILNLVLGPLDLNLLGLRVQLNQVVLDITAIPGAGNLLGNLLCAIVGLFDGGVLGPVLGLLSVLAFLATLFPPVPAVPAAAAG